MLLMMVAAAPRGCQLRSGGRRRIAAARPPEMIHAMAETPKNRPRSRRCSGPPIKKAGLAPGLFAHPALRLSSLDVARLFLAFVSIGDFEGNFLAFLQALESRHVDGREVSEEVFAAAVRGDEAKALRVVKPFNYSGCHCARSLKID
jgi:hypothetical protein